MRYNPSEIFPIKVGNKWEYTMNGKWLNKKINVEVIDNIDNYYLIKMDCGKLGAGVMIKSDIDISIVSLSKKTANSIDSNTDFESIPKTDILKSPIISGTTWENEYGYFNIIDSKYNLKLGGKSFNDCIYMQLKDTSNAYNNIYIKGGIGILYASIYVDGIGRINLYLNKFN